MKKRKQLLFRLLPMVLVIALTIGLSEIFYNNMITSETEKCWEELSTARGEASREISTRLNTSITVLDLAADAIVMNASFEDTDTVLAYLTQVRDRTIFDRIDVVFPNGTILVQSGETVADNGDKTYGQLLEKGSHISQRVLDFYTGKETIHVFAPVYDSTGQPVAILGGSVFCATLGELFSSAHYGDGGRMFLVDLRDGNFVLDKWHGELGNIYHLDSLQMLEPFQELDLVADLMAGGTGQAAFLSQENGKPSYMTYAPVEGTAFSLGLMVQEDVVFSSVREMRRTLMWVGVTEAVLLLLFSLWIYYFLHKSLENETRAKEAELALLQEKDKELQSQYEAVADRQEFLEVMAVNLPGGYHRCSTNEGFHLSFVSNSFLEITGYTRQQLRDEANDSYINLVAPQDRTYFLSLEPELVAKGKIECTYRIRRRDGSIRWVQDATQYVERGEERFYQCALLDIDDFVNDLNKAKKEAEESSMAKTTFLFNASHDIRTPMNAILGFARMIQENAWDRPVVESTVEKILQAGQTLMTLLNDVLELSRIERGKDELNPEPVYLYDHCKNLYEMFAADMEKKGIHFAVERDVTHPHVLCDPMKLSRIGMNFLSNARKFTPKGGSVTFGVKELTCDGKNATYCFYSRDTGIGMSKEFQDRAFQQFEREHTATESGVTGSGLGLSITKKLIDLMGGQAQIRSELGKGTEIRAILTFPLVEEGAVQPKKQSAGDLDMSGKRVLLVEDNEFNREIARYILQQMHFTVDEAENGSVCMDMLLHRDGPAYDLIFMDLQMPVMDGYTATAEIRNLPDRRLANIPILAMTANAFEEDKRKCLEVGMNGHVGKPLDLEALTQALSLVFGADAK